MIPSMRHTAWSRHAWGLLIVILALTALVITGVVAPHAAITAAQVGGATASAPPATPVLATSPAATDAAECIRSLAPQVATETMTETVRAVLAAYDQRMASADTAIGPVPVPNSGTLVYLPAIRVARPSSPTPTPTPRPAKPADLTLTIWPSPSIIVVRGGTLAYELRVKNCGAGAAHSARVTLPYSRQQLLAIDSRFSDPRDWVSAVTDDYLDVTFGPIAAGEERTGTIVFRVSEWLPDRTVISMRATYAWSDARDGGGWRSNWAPLLIGRGNESAPWVWLVVDPLGGVPGTTHHFFTDRFIPSEQIYTWLNTPDGVKPLELRGVADLMGRVWIDFRSSGLRPGSYQLVLYGARSNLTAVATFIVW